MGFAEGDTVRVADLVGVNVAVEDPVRVGVGEGELEGGGKVML